MMSTILRRSGFLAVAVIGSLGCEPHDVDLDLPTSGRSLSRGERRELQQIADATFRDVRGHLDGLPPRLALIVRWERNVIPETGENGTAAFPAT